MTAETETRITRVMTDRQEGAQSTASPSTIKAGNTQSKCRDTGRFGDLVVKR